MEKILSSAMAEEELTKRNARKEEIAAAVAEKREAFEQSDVDTRDNLIAEIDELVKEDGTLDGEIAELESTREKFKEQEERLSLLGNLTPEKVEERENMNETRDLFATEEYNAAYVNYLKTGDKTQLRALTTDMTNAPIPTILADAIETSWAEYGDLVNLVSVANVKGYFTVPYEASATDAAYHDEGDDAPTEEVITLGEVTIIPKMIKKWISWTDELEALAPAALLEYIGKEVPHKILELLNTYIVSGTVTNNKGVAGIIGNDNTTVVTSLLNFNAPNIALAQLKTWRNITVVMNPVTFFQDVMGLSDTTGRPIYSVMQDNAGRPKYYFAGFPVVFSDAVAAYSATSTDPYMIVGNFEGYKLNLPNGRAVETVLDRLSLSREDKSYLVGKIFAGGNIVKLGYFAAVRAVSA